MPRPSHLNPDNILRFLQVRSATASTTEISQGLHLKKSDNRPLFKMLSKLKKRRAIEELPGGRYRLPGRKSERSAPSQEAPQDAPRRPLPLASHDEVTGRLVLHHDGYGFVVPDSPMPQLARDVFIPRDATQDAMHGDHVLAKIQRLGGVTGAPRAEGRIGRPLDRAHPTPGALSGRGPLPHVFAAEVLNEAERGAQPVNESQRAGREDFRHLPIVTIDGETARDFDDAVYVEHRADSGWHLQVHIADVGHYVRTATPLDLE